MAKKHIQGRIAGKSLCGQIGGTAYDPTKSDCDSCLEIFKDRYPGAFEQWEKKNDSKS